MHLINKLKTKQVGEILKSGAKSASNTSKGVLTSYSYLDTLAFAKAINMRNIITLFALFILIISTDAQIIGSKERSFTDSKRMEYEYQGFGLNTVLFYISSPIMMRRVLPPRKVGEPNPKGRVAFENGKAYEYYELADKASCKFESETEDQAVLTMRFGQDQDELLNFAKVQGMGGDTNFYYELVVGEEKVISFLGLDWELLSHPKVRLNVKEKRNTKVDLDKTKSRGMRMDGTEKKALFQKRKKN